MNRNPLEIAVFGGSFNPPHLAHALVVEYVLSTYRLEKLLVVPTYRHPFAKSVAPYEHRVQMCKLAMAHINGVEISRIEEQLGGESYTFKTLQAISTHYPNRRLRLVIGSDILAETRRWYRFEQVKQLAPLIVLSREGHSIEDPKGPAFPDISSSQIRRLLTQGLCTKGQLAESVAAYIEQYGLYREG
jgi:nicotinate-nucleotide adenylyltransferase